MDFRVRSIGEICTRICSGGTPKSNISEYYNNGSIPWLNTKEVSFNRIRNTEKYITEEGLNNSSAKWISKNSVIVAMYGATAGKSAIAKIPLTTNQACCNLEVNPKMSDYRYVYYWLKNHYEEISSLANGGAQQNLNAGQIRSFPISLPSLENQKKIALILDSIDIKIDLDNRINDYLLELLKAAAKNLYAEYERNEDRELPEGWRWVEIDEIAEMVCRGITPKYNPDSDETILGQTCVRNNLVLLENGRLHMPKKVTEKWLQKYDLLINSTGVGSLGRTAQVWFEPTKLVVDSHVTIVRCENAKHALYLGFWAFEHEKYIESLHTGSTGQTELPRDHVKAIRIVLPSEEELEKFNAIAAPAVELIVANQQESKRLAELRNALLPKLMSGEIDVSKIDLTQLNNHLLGC